VSVNN